KTNAYEYSKDNGTTWTAATSTVTYTFTGLTSGTYQCKVRVTDNVGNSIISNTVDISIMSNDSLIGNIYSNNYSDGVQNLTVNSTTYQVEVINISGNVTYSTNQSFGNSTVDGPMVILKCTGNITINSGVTITTATRKKGFMIVCKGTLTNNGIISMTARGANATGQNVYLWKNSDTTYEYVPAVGANGGTSFSYTGRSSQDGTGKAGSNGISRQTGGGATGGNFNDRNTATTVVSPGSAGTSYSGGTGSGGVMTWTTSANPGVLPGSNGGAGGNGWIRGDGFEYSYPLAAGGGAGNPGGSCVTLGGASVTNGQSGTGGLLIIYSNTFNNIGTISNDGSNGGGVSSYSGSGGGGSGGGSTNIFYTTLSNQGTIQALGGTGGSGNSYGGRGGNGSITLKQIVL
ncbi:MAG: hypothetical protein N2749_07140, partial [Clostridia bacterium]|nr:hypothetical protein [Clostridia bacterium]